MVHLFNTFRFKFVFWIPTLWYSSIFQIVLILKVQKQPLDKGSLRKAKIKRCKITFRIVLDIGPGTADSDVEFNSTMDR